MANGGNAAKAMQKILGKIIRPLYFDGPAFRGYLNFCAFNSVCSGRRRPDGGRVQLSAVQAAGPLQCDRLGQGPRSRGQNEHLQEQREPRVQGGPRGAVHLGHQGVPREAQVGLSPRNGTHCCFTRITSFHFYSSSHYSELLAAGTFQPLDSSLISGIKDGDFSEHFVTPSGVSSVVKHYFKDCQDVQFGKHVERVDLNADQSGWKIKTKVKKRKETNL